MSSPSQQKANAFWEKAGGLRTFASPFVALKQADSYSAELKVGGKVNITERATMGTMLGVSPKIAEEWGEMKVKCPKPVRRRPSGSRLYVYMGDQMHIWAQHLADAVKNLESRG